MARKDTVDGFSIIVFVPVIYSRSVSAEAGVSSARRDADDIQDAIKKHVGCDYPVARRPEIEAQTTYQCEHCQSQWTEISVLYNGGCCDADEDERVARERKVAT